MNSVVHLPRDYDFDLPLDAGSDDVRFPPSLAAHFISELTSPGDLVFDPFAGFGTTLYVAERMRRRPVGLEYLPDRVAFIAGNLHDPHAIRHGDAMLLETYDMPEFACSITSPPYTFKGDPTNPFTSCTLAGNGYEAYLSDIANIYRQIAILLRPGGRAVVNVINNTKPEGTTFLAWDIAAAIDRVIPFEQEVIVVSEPSELGRPSEHAGFEYCMVFRKPEEA